MFQEPNLRKQKNYYFTTSKQKIDPIDPKPDQIYIEDIAHATSLLCRFNGHIRSFYSVCEHSMLVKDILRKKGEDFKTQLAGLLHDSAEYLLGDIPSPVKIHWYEAEHIEAVLYKKIMEALGIPNMDPETKERVFQADMESREIERKALCFDYERSPTEIIPKYGPLESKKPFLKTYTELMHACGWCPTPFLKRKHPWRYQSH